MPHHTLHSALRRLPLRASLYVVGAALACVAAAPVATAAESNSKARLDFDSCAKPQYPHEDLKANHQGTVALGFLVDETGHVKESKVAESSGFATLDEAARTALAMCTFYPAQENGKPVAQWTNVKYVWTTR